jgi:hypothetical protein
VANFIGSLARIACTEARAGPSAAGETIGAMPLVSSRQARVKLARPAIGTVAP